MDRLLNFWHDSKAPPPKNLGFRCKSIKSKKTRQKNTWNTLRLSVFRPPQLKNSAYCWMRKSWEFMAKSWWHSMMSSRRSPSFTRSSSDYYGPSNLSETQTGHLLGQDGTELPQTSPASGATNFETHCACSAPLWQGRATNALRGVGCYLCILAGESSSICLPARQMWCGGSPVWEAAWKSGLTSTTRFQITPVGIEAARHRFLEWEQA